jgi:hypothetical protein
LCFSNFFLSVADMLEPLGIGFNFIVYIYIHFYFFYTPPNINLLKLRWYIVSQVSSMFIYRESYGLL